MATGVGEASHHLILYISPRHVRGEQKCLVCPQKTKQKKWAFPLEPGNS